MDGEENHSILQLSLISLRELFLKGVHFQSDFSWQHFEIDMLNQNGCTAHTQKYYDGKDLFVTLFTCTKTDTGPQSSSVIIWCLSALSMMSHPLLLVSRHNTCSLESMQQGSISSPGPVSRLPYCDYDHVIV